MSIGHRARRLSRRWRRSGPASTLLVPVPEAREVLAAISPLGQGSADQESGLPPHITALYPFLGTDSLDEAVHAALAGVAAATSPFPFSLTRVDRFPGITYLAPEPADPFVALVESIGDRFPHHPPYGRPDWPVVPHLTVHQGSSEPADLRAQLVARLPVTAWARELHLMVVGPASRWQLAGRFRFSSPSPPDP